MRLIDADNISFCCDYEGDCTGNINDCKKCENYICIFRDIQEQPIAYDIDKVVGELESELKKGNIAIDFGEFRLFEIVKQGVVSDDKTKKCD